MTFGGVDPVLKYYEFNLSSDDASQAFTKDHTHRNWPLFRLGGKRPLKNIQGLKILEAEIPFTWYLFSATDTLVVTDTQTSTVTNMSIGNGNYSATELSTLLAANYPVTFTYNPATLKFTLLLTNNNTFKVSTTSERLAYLLGLKAGVEYFSVPGSGATDYVTFPHVAQLTGPNFVYICSDSLGALAELYLPKTLTSAGNCGAEIAKVPVSVGPGNVIFWNDPDPQKYFDVEHLNTLTEADFYIRSNIPGLDHILDLNGAPFSLKLAVLENDLSQTVSYTGLAQNDRVVKRIRAL